MKGAAPALLARTGSVILTLDRDGVMTYLNPAAERLCGRAARELIGELFVAVLDPYSQDKAALMLERTLADGSVTDWELNHVQPEGPPVLVGYTTALLRDTAGEPAGFSLVGNDLTAKLELTARLVESNQRLEGALLQLEKAHAQLLATQTQLVQSEKMRALGQLVAGVAHEINNPAGFVANNLSELALLVPALRALYDAYAPLKEVAGPGRLAAIRAAEARAGFLWQDLPDLVSESRDGIERIRQIVLSLSNFARRDEPARKEADINAGLRSTLQIVRPQCGERIVLCENLGALPTLRCHPGELNQVFLNLLINAMQAIAERGNIWVSSALEAGRIVVAIRDDGQGMDAATLARLGEPFFTTKPVGSGTGLGLAIAHGIIEHHHGRLRFESAPGRGTTAFVELPLQTMGREAGD